MLVGKERPEPARRGRLAPWRPVVLEQLAGAKHGVGRGGCSVKPEAAGLSMGRPRLPRRMSVAAGEKVEQQLPGSRGRDGLRVNVAVV